MRLRRRHESILTKTATLPGGGLTVQAPLPKSVAKGWLEMPNIGTTSSLEAEGSIGTHLLVSRIGLVGFCRLNQTATYLKSSVSGVS